MRARMFKPGAMDFIGARREAEHQDQQQETRSVTKERDFRKSGQTGICLMPECSEQSQPCRTAPRLKGGLMGAREFQSFKL